VRSDRQYDETWRNGTGAAVGASLAQDLGFGHTGLRERDDKHKVRIKGLVPLRCWFARGSGSCDCHLSSCVDTKSQDDFWRSEKYLWVRRICRNAQ
jgi:hypothetical protein